MALNIKNDEVERLVEALAAFTGESKTEAIKVAVRDRLERTHARSFQNERVAAALAWLESDVWPRIACEGQPLTREQEDTILGYGEDGLPLGSGS